MQNQLNRITVIDLAREYLSETVTRYITSPGFMVPTTVAGFGSSLYAVNAWFGTPPTPETEYTGCGSRRADPHDRLPAVLAGNRCSSTSVNRPLTIEAVK